MFNLGDQGVAPYYYEWTVGIDNITAGLDLLNVSSQSVWFDSGSHQSATFTTSMSHYRGIEYTSIIPFVCIWTYLYVM